MRDIRTRQPQAMPYLLAEVLALTVMEFLGSSVQLVTFREQVSCAAFGLRPLAPSAMLASSIISNYFLTIPTVINRILSLAPGLSHVQYGQSPGVFVRLRLGIATFATLGGDRQRHQHDAGTQIINQIIWLLSCFFPA